MSIRVIRSLLFVFLAASSFMSTAHAANPLQAGVRGNFLFPITNFGLNGVTLTGVQISVSSNPAWMNVLPRVSDLGPHAIPPGQTYTFDVEYQVGSTFNPSAAPVEMNFNIATDTSSLPGIMTSCHLSSPDGLVTVRWDCVDNLGNHVLQTLFPDTTPPVTTLALMRPIYMDSSNNVYVSSYTTISLTASDPVFATSATAGVAFTGYSVDTVVSSTAGLVAYSNPFIVSEGTHTIYYASSDSAGNAEVIHSTTVIFDGTPPNTQMQIFGSSGTDSQGNFLLSTATVMDIPGSDPLSNGVTSGLSSILVFVDTETPFQVTSTFTLTQGFHRIGYFGVDNVGNGELAHFINAYFSVPSDTQPPVTQIIAYGTGAVTTSGYLLQNGSSITFAAIDLPSTGTVAGLDKTYFLVDVLPQDCPGGAPASFPDYNYPYGSCQNALFIGPFAIGLGTHTIAYYSIDRAGNKESTNTMTVMIDTMAPTTQIAFAGGLQFSSVTVIYASGDSGIVFSSTDPPVNGLSAGILQTLVSVDSAAFTVFSSTVTGLVQGPHTIAYLSIDRVLNRGATTFSSVFIDTTPPVSQVGVLGEYYLDSGLIVYNANSSFTFTAQDPVVNSGASGAYGTRYSIDISSSMDFLYTGPFTVGSGTHTVFFASQDRVGNTEAVKSAGIRSVDSGEPPIGQAGAAAAVAIDASGNLWDIFDGATQLGVAKFSSQGAFISSTTLPSPSQSSAWSIRFDGSGNAFVVGTSSGLSTVMNDVVVYKIGSGGSALVSSVTYNNSLNGDDLAYDATGQVWIAGMVPNAWGGVNMALWSFDTASGLISLTTGYSGSAGVDAGTGITIDGSGNIWVVGFSSNPATQGANKLDLALWEFNSAGTSLLAGPFLRPGYMWYPDSRIGAKILASSSTLVVAASRLNTLGNTDLAVLTWDLYGNLTSTLSWHSDNGGDETPLGMAIDSSGNLVIVGVSSTSSAIWTFSSTGTFISAVTVGTGPVQSVAAGGGDLWLALTSSSVPYKFTGGTALSGSAGIDGGIGALGIRDPSPLIASLSDFYYRNIYAFPNPSRRNRGVTIRTQVGLADSIDIHIYDIAGQLVNRGSPAQPRIFDDGNGKGPQYTYDYSWDVSGAGSGVYAYSVTAKKTGNADIKKVKKVAVIK